MVSDALWEWEGGDALYSEAAEWIVRSILTHKRCEEAFGQVRNPSG